MTKKRSLLSRLRINGAYYLISVLLLLVGVPLYQTRVLTPAGYNNALNALGMGHYALYLSWVSAHTWQFISYRVLLIVAFALLLSQPFSLFRIIVAQELLGQMEHADEEREEDTSEQKEEEPRTDEQPGNKQATDDVLPPYAWRGKGFAIIAAWAGLFGLILYLVGGIVGTLYLGLVSNNFSVSTPVPGNFPLFASIFSITSNTAGLGLLALSTLFFGAMIARSGRALWPGIWVAFGYMGLAVAALLSGSAVAVTSTPVTGQAALSTPAILLFALWILWLAIMLLRLQPEA